MARQAELLALQGSASSSLLLLSCRASLNGPNLLSRRGGRKTVLQRRALSFPDCETKRSTGRSQHPTRKERSRSRSRDTSIKRAEPKAACHVGLDASWTRHAAFLRRLSEEYDSLVGRRYSFLLRGVTHALPRRPSEMVLQARSDCLANRIGVKFATSDALCDRVQTPLTALECSNRVLQ